MRKRLKGNAGFSYIDTIISVSIILVFTIISTNFFGLITAQLNIMSIASSAKRQVEISGGITDSIRADIKDQIESVNLDGSKAIISGTNYPVQLRDPVEIEIQYPYDFQITAFDGVTITTIQLGARRTGSSERFFK